MLTDRFPELATLDPQEKLILAGELWRDATHSSQGAADLSESAVAAIERRLDAYLAAPESGISWDDLKLRISSGQNK